MQNAFFPPCVLCYIICNMSDSGEFLNICFDILVFRFRKSTFVFNPPFCQDLNRRPSRPRLTLNVFRTDGGTGFSV